MVLLVGYGCLRFGEIATLRVRRLDLDKARLEIAKNAPENGGVIELVPPSPRKGRTVPYPRLLVGDLRTLVANQTGTLRVRIASAAGCCATRTSAMMSLSPLSTAPGSARSGRTT